MGHKTGEPVEPKIREALRRRIGQVGEAAACEDLGISPKTLARALAGLGVHRGTRLLIATGLGIS